jgi:hypothetical protein
MYLAALLALAVPQATDIPQGATLTAEIRAADAALFDLYFLGCDPVRLDAMVTPDFEMYHDRNGVVATDDKMFVADYTRSCEAKKMPDAWRNRRALVPESLHVEPIPGYGAIEEGDHLFYERKGDGPEKLSGRAHFVQLWKKSAQGWQLARVFSYSHQAAQ